MKKVFTIFFISLMIFGSFSLGYCHNYPVYAEIQDENLYEPLRQQSDLVKAFQAYCKSRDLTVEGSALDAVTTWTTSAFNKACNNVGLNMTQIQAEIKAQYDENGQPLKYLFYATGVDAFNRIFAQFLQDNELEVGDTDVNKQVYSGKYFTDDNGNTCLMYIVKWSTPNTAYFNVNDTDYIDSYGTFFSNGTPDNFSSVGSKVQTYFIGGRAYNFTVNTWVQANSYPQFQTIPNGITCCSVNGSSSNYQYSFGLSPNFYGGFSVFYNNVLNKYFIGTTAHRYANNATSNNLSFALLEIQSGTTLDASDTNIYIYAPIINNITYEGDTIIYPDGEPTIPDDPSPDPPVVGPDPDKPTDPLPPVDPDYPDDPVTPQTPPDWDIELPDFTDFDWIMTGLEKKFPWDIPFNIMFMMSLFVAEPAAPHFVGDIDLKVTTWHYDLDLAPFEEIAKLFRTFFFLGFILGLMLFTKQLIWG